MRFHATQGAAGVVAAHRCVCFFKQTNAESSELLDLKDQFQGKEASTGIPDQIGQTYPLKLSPVRLRLPGASMARYNGALRRSYIRRLYRFPGSKGYPDEELASENASGQVLGVGRGAPCIRRTWPVCDRKRETYNPD